MGGLSRGFESGNLCSGRTAGHIKTFRHCCFVRACSRWDNAAIVAPRIVLSFFEGVEFWLTTPNLTCHPRLEPPQQNSFAAWAWFIPRP